MSLIQKPKPIKYHILNKKVKITEDTYSKLMSYLNWSDQFDGKNDIDCFFEESLKYIFNNDKKFKKHMKKLSKNLSETEVV